MPVGCTTLEQIFDSNALRAIDILKMDIEGGEYEALYGTPPELLARVSAIRPRIVDHTHSMSPMSFW